MEHERLKEYGTGFLICGEELFYSEIIAARTCFYCGVTKPLSDRERKLSNLITAECLRVIAESGGARCCKRESFHAIITAVEFVRRESGVVLPVEMPARSSFTDRNRVCLRERCGFYGRQSGEPVIGGHIP
jgi:hypothetical protein